MSTSSATAYVSSVDYARALRRGWWLVAAGLLLGVVLAAIGLVFVPRSYTASGSVLVNPAGDTGQVANGRTSGPVNLDTEAQLVTASVVARRAQERLGGNQTLRDLVRQVSVTVPPNSAVLTISFTDRSPERAARGAAAFAESYLQHRQELTDAIIKSHESAIQKQVDRVTTQLREVDDRLAQLPVGSPQRPSQLAQQSQLQQRLTELNSQFGSVGTVGANVGEVITDPVVPTRASSPDPRILLASGVMLGLVLGLLAALWRDARDERIFGRQDLARLGLDVLVPVLDIPADGQIVSATSSRYDVDAIRMLRNSLVAQLRDRRGGVLVAPIGNEQATSTLALNLAAAIARAGSSCISASANSRISPPEQMHPGLADLLLGHAELQAVVRSTDEANLQVIGPGADGTLTPELLAKSQVGDLIAELREQCEIVVVDVAPTSENADAQSLAPFFDGVVLVATERVTTTHQVRDAIEQLDHVSARNMGAVILSRPSSRLELGPRDRSKIRIRATRGT